MFTRKKKIQPQPIKAQELKEAGEEQVENEKRDLRDLAENIIAAHDTRVKIVGEIIEDTHQMMANFKTKREQMAGELQKLLAKGESLRKKDFERMMADIIDTHAKREEEVKEMLESFRREEETVAEKLRSLLKKGEEVRIKDFKKMMVEIKQGQEKRIQATNESVSTELRRMQEEVHTMLDNFKRERQSVASAWHQMLGFFRTSVEETGSAGSEQASSPQARVVSNPGPSPRRSGFGHAGGPASLSLQRDEPDLPADLSAKALASAEVLMKAGSDPNHEEYDKRNKIQRRIV